MGAEVGDIEVDAGKSGAVSALSWYGRLKKKIDKQQKLKEKRHNTTYFLVKYIQVCESTQTRIVSKKAVATVAIIINDSPKSPPWQKLLDALE